MESTGACKRRQSLYCELLHEKSRTKKKDSGKKLQVLDFMARPAGFAPTTPWFAGW